MSWHVQGGTQGALGGPRRPAALELCQRNGGHTLIEVLVALLILAVGALGASAMALSAIRTARQSALLTLAAQLAANAGEAMRANAAATNGADALNPYLQLDYDAVADGPPTPAPLAGCSAAPCDASALAQADLDSLRATVYARFPFGRIKICRDSASWDAAALALRWDCDGAPAAPAVVKLGWRFRAAGDEQDGAAGRAPPVMAVAVAAAAPAAP